MNKYLYNNDDVFISPEQGWEQMKVILDKKLPFNTKPARNIYLSVLVAASLVIIFLFSTLLLNNIAVIRSFKMDVNKSKTKISETPNNTTQPRKLMAYSGNHEVNKPAIPNPVQSEYNRIAFLPTDGNKFIGSNDVLPALAHEILNEPIEILPIEILAATPNRIALSGKLFNTDSTVSSLKKGNTRTKSGWNLSVGLAINAMAGGKQKFRPYPTADLRYNVSKQLFLSAGLAAGSVVAAESRGVAKTVLVNDVANNIQFYHAINQYDHISYADVPLLAGTPIGKNISVVAGIQASVLLKAKRETFIEVYDFQMRLAGGASNGLITGTAAPVSETNYKVEVRNVDYRFLSGIQYDVNKLNFSVMYQHALHPVLKGDLTSRNKNQLVTFNVKLNIR